MKAMIHKLSKVQKSVIASVLALVMVFGVFAFIAPIEAQAISVDATDPGFYNIAYGENGKTTFGPDTRIRVINYTRTGKSKNDAVYQFDGALSWTPVGDKYIVWEGTVNNTFYGVYPYNAEYESFKIPTDQAGGVQDADWMTDDFTANKNAGKVDFTFQHRLAKVTVNITNWNSEFTGKEEITAPKIYTKGIEVEATYENGGATITATGEDTGIAPYVKGTSFTAIVAPAAYNASDKFMTFTVAGQDMTVLAAASQLTKGLEPGNHYTFDLTVGKDVVEITEVKVNGWANGGTINGGSAEQYTDPIVNLNGNTLNIFVPADTPVASVTEAVRNAVTNGATAIVVGGAVNDECYDAVIEERSEAMVFFKDLEENNYIASNGTTYTCVIGSESAEKYVLISTTPRTNTQEGGWGYLTKLLTDEVPGARLILSTEEAWSVYKQMVKPYEENQYHWLLGNDSYRYLYHPNFGWIRDPMYGGYTGVWAWFPVFDVPLS